MAALTQQIVFSKYCVKLNGPERLRYEEKVTLCGFDPFVLKKSDFLEDTSIWPQVGYPDIVNYLVLQTSWATKEQMKAYKSLEAYNVFVSGWVKSVCAKSASQNKVVLFSRVSFS